LIGRDPLGIDLSPSHDQRRLHFTTMTKTWLVWSWDSTSPAPWRQNNQAWMAHDWLALGHHFRNLIVAEVVDRRWDTIGK
jgi:hypothetical protein